MEETNEPKFKPGDKIVASRPYSDHYFGMICTVVEAKWLISRREHMYKTQSYTGETFLWWEHEIDAASVEVGQ